MTMEPDERARLAEQVRKLLATRRDNFLIHKYMFEPYDVNGELNGVRSISESSNPHPQPHRHGVDESKTVSAAALRVLLDYFESNEWPMSFVEYCAGMFHGRPPEENETAFDLLPDVRTRVSADRLGFGHIYGRGEG